MNDYAHCWHRRLPTAFHICRLDSEAGGDVMGTAEAMVHIPHTAILGHGLVIIVLARLELGYKARD